MKSLRLVAAAFLTMGAVAAITPSALASQARGGVIHWGAVVGRLDSYNAGHSATVSVSQTRSSAVKSTTTNLTVGLGFKTKLFYVGGHHAAPFLVAGDRVLVHLKWKGSSARGAWVSYVTKGNLPSGSGLGTSRADDGTSRFHGMYDAADSTTLTLAVKDWSGSVDDFTLTSNTNYFEGGQQVANPTLTNGQHLAVEATQQPDGSWSADSVVVGDRKGDRGGDGQSEQFAGNFAASTTSTLTLANPKGTRSRTFTVDSNTKYFDQSGNPASSLTYTTGERLHVQATEQIDGTWLAGIVCMDDGHGRSSCNRGGNGQNHHFRGTYVSDTTTSLIVADGDGNNETFTLNSNTQYFDASGNPVSSLAYTPGQVLFVTAVHQSDGSWLATEVSLKTPAAHSGGDDNNEDFGGTYVSDTTTSLTINDHDGNPVTFTLNSGTQYFDSNGAAAVSLTYSTGEWLHVEAAQQPDGSWVATVVSQFAPKAKS